MFKAVSLFVHAANFCCFSIFLLIFSNILCFVMQIHGTSTIHVSSDKEILISVA